MSEQSKGAQMVLVGAGFALAVILIVFAIAIG
jgi:hypothetical protein